MKDIQSLQVISPVDGRYFSQTKPLVQFFSEAALIKFRIQTELNYLLFLIKNRVIQKISQANKLKIENLLQNIPLNSTQRVKKIEAAIQHDVKAVEYFLRNELIAFKVDPKLLSYIHFGLTSEDINSCAYGLALKSCLQQLIWPELHELINKLAVKANEYKDLAMLARTHGQPAVATTLGKELFNFTFRLYEEVNIAQSLPVCAKLNGAVGNFNALDFAVPDNNWITLSQKFIQSLGLTPIFYTTQIIPADPYIRVFQSLRLINTILIGLNQDIWRYISDDYLIQQVNKHEVGSSTMPHKVNPIDFENSEGNLGIANTLLDFYIEKLPITRLQRDLSDSPVKRTFGVALAHCLIGYISFTKGLNKIKPNLHKLNEVLNEHWEILSEGVQTLLRTTSDEQAYEKMKDLTQGKQLTKNQFNSLIKSLEINPSIKHRLRDLTPLNYLGVAIKLVDLGLKDIGFDKRTKSLFEKLAQSSKGRHPGKRGTSTSRIR